MAVPPDVMACDVIPLHWQFRREIEYHLAMYGEGRFAEVIGQVPDRFIQPRRKMSSFVKNVGDCPIIWRFSNQVVGKT